MKFQIYRTRRKQWRWRLLARNKRIIACSGESYRRRVDCVEAVALVQMTDLSTQREFIE